MQTYDYQTQAIINTSIEADSQARADELWALFLNRVEGDICYGAPDTGFYVNVVNTDGQAALAATREIVQALYADRETGQLTGENTLAGKSACDFLDAVTDSLDRHGFTPELKETCPECGRIVKSFVHNCPNSANQPEIHGCPACDDRCPECE